MKDFTKSIDINKDDIYKLFNTSYYIGTQDIKELVKTSLAEYLKKNNLNIDNIIVDEYSIISKTPNVQMYFENNENNNKYTLYPSVIAKIMPNEIAYKTPTLKGTLVGDNCIKWYIDHEEGLKHYHIILDEFNNVIGKIPVGKDTFVEYNLKYNAIYGRKVVKANDYGMSKESDIVYIKTKSSKINTKTHTYKEKENINYKQIKDNAISENLKAFHSGVGDNNDCLTLKQSKDNFNETCNLYFSIYGHYKEKIKKFNQVSFSYRIKADAIKNIETRKGYIRFSAYAYPIEQIKFIVVKMINKPVEVQFEVRAYVNYYKKINDTYIPATKVIAYKGEDTKYTITEPIPKMSKKKVSGNLKVKDYVKGAIENDEEIKASIVPMEYKPKKITIKKTSLDYPSNNFPETLEYNKNGYKYKLTKKNKLRKIQGSKKSVPVTKKIYYTVGDYYIKDPHSNINDSLNWKKGCGNWKYLNSIPINLRDSNGKKFTIDDMYITNKYANDIKNGCVETGKDWRDIIPLTDYTLNGVKVSLPEKARKNLTLFYNNNDAKCSSSLRSIYGQTAYKYDYPNWNRFSNYRIELVRVSKQYIILTGEKILTKEKEIYEQEYEGTMIKEGNPLKLFYEIDHYEIWDNYQFDMIDVYDSKANRKWGRSEFGSIKTKANYLNNDMIDPNSYIYTYGWSDGNMYCARSDNEIVKEFDGSNGEFTIVTREDLKLNKPLKNICGDTISENDKDVITAIEWTYMGKHVQITEFYDVNKRKLVYYKPQNKNATDGNTVTTTFHTPIHDSKTYISVSPVQAGRYEGALVGVSYIAPINQSNVCVTKSSIDIANDGIVPMAIVRGTITKNYSSYLNTPLTYEYDDTYTQYFIDFSELFEMEHDNEQKYKFIVFVEDCSDNIYIQNQKIIGTPRRYVFENLKDFKVSLTAGFKKAKEHFTAIYPKYNKDPLYGIVNGRFDNSNKEGKKDFNTVLPTIPIPDNIDKKTLKFSILIGDIIIFDEKNNVLDINNGFVNYKFKNEIKYGISNTNGDVVTFSSSYGLNREQITKSLIKTINSNKIFLNSLEDYTNVIRIYKPKSKKVYENYTFDLICDNSDVKILDYYPKKIDFCNNNFVDITVKLKGDFSSKSMWHPKIHNGYYYENQKEYFLYSDFHVYNPLIYTKNIKNNEIKKLNIPQYTSYEISKFFKYDLASYHLKIYLKKQIYTKKDVTYVFNEKTDFINTFNNEKNFYFDDLTGLIYCKPTEVNTKYYKKYKNKSEYISGIYYSPNTITHIGRINFVSIDYDYISFCIRYYDNIECAWTDWQSVEPNSDINLNVNTNNIQYKVIIKNYLVYRKMTAREVLCCKPHFIKNYNKKQSKNIELKNNIIETKEDKKGKYVSNITDYGTDNTKVTMFAHKRGTSDINIASITDKGIYTRFNNIMLINYTAGRYFLYTIDLYGFKDKVFQIYKTIQTETNDYPKSILGNFGHISIKCTTEDFSKADTIEKNYTTKIPYNMDWHDVTGGIWIDIKKQIKELGYSLEDILKIEITNTNNNTELKFENKLNNPIKAKSKKVVYEEETKNEFVTFKDSQCILSPKPQQFCPVTIQDSKIGTLKQVNFKDSKGEISLTNTEKFISNGYNVYTLKYSEIKLDTLDIYIDNLQIPKENYVLDNNLIKFKNNIEKNKKILVQYQINNSFIVDYNYDITKDSYIYNINTCYKYNNETEKYDLINKCNNYITDKILFNKNDENKFVKIITNINDDDFNITRICYESNIKDNIAIQKQIALNPVYNLYNEGFIFISHQDNKPKNIEIHANPGVIHGDGKEISKIYIHVTDRYNSPVTNERLNITCLYGELVIDNDITDINGIVSIIYTSYTIKNDIINVRCTSNECNNNIQIKVK